MWSNWFEILASDAIQSNVSDIWQFLFCCKEMVKTGLKIRFPGSLLEVFCLHPLMLDELRPNVLLN